MVGGQTPSYVVDGQIDYDEDPYGMVGSCSKSEVVYYLFVGEIIFNLFRFQLSRIVLLNILTMKPPLLK